MVVVTCNCGMDPISLETRTPGKNRGRWYLRCPTGTCKFFKWDESPHSFIKHPTEAYAAQQPLSGQRIQSRFQFRPTTKDSETSLTKTQVKVVFTLLSSKLIGMKVQSNLTLNPVIAKIENIQWNEEYNQWTIPASVPSYNLAIASLPTDTPNLQIDIDPIPPTLLDLIINNTLLEVQARAAAQSDFMTEVEQRYIDFAESPTRLKSKIQKEAVKLGIERNGRIVLGNENGVGLNEEGLSLCQVYQDEWPVLVTCPAVFCRTWKQEIQSYLELDSSEVCILDPKVHKKDMFTKKALNESNKKCQQSSDIILIPTGIKRRASTPGLTKARQPYKRRRAVKLTISDYNSDSSDEEEEDEEMDRLLKRELVKTEFKETDLELDSIHNNKVKFYIASHEHTAKRRNEFIAQKFKVILCADSHLLRDWMKGEAKCIGDLLLQTKRTILLSPCIRDALPVDTYHQLTIVAPKLYPKFDLFAKRYCDQKSTVFGLSYKGRCNQAEFLHLMDTNVWYCPRLAELKLDFPDVVQETIILSPGSGRSPGRKKTQPRQEEAEQELEDGQDDAEKEEQEAREVSNRALKARKKETLDYLRYVTATYRRPKIALVYQTKAIYDCINQEFLIPLLKHRKMKFAHILTSTSEEDVDLLCQEYNKSHSMQFIVLDIKAFPQFIACLSSVDLFIFLETPMDIETTVDKVELLCRNPERKGPLLIKYLVQAQ